MKDKYIGKYDSVFKELLEKREEQRLIDKIRTESEHDKCLRKMQEVIDGLTGDIMNSSIGSSWDDFEKEAFADEEIKESDLSVKKALELLDKELKKYNIPNKPSKDGVARIDGMTVDEYFEKVGLW